MLLRNFDLFSGRPGSNDIAHLCVSTLVAQRSIDLCCSCFFTQGSVKLDRGTTHLLRRSDVEHLVRQGLLQELENEST